MSYFAPYIDSAGLHIPTYQDIVNQLVADAQNIFGQDIYLGYDSQDYQWISAFASMIYDSFLAAQAAYNSRSPTTAIGAALDAVVSINGIVRMGAVYSTCPVVVTGTPGTPITGGIAGDVNGNYWSLPSPTIIGSNGTAIVTATCQTAGAIIANPGDINTIVTPTQGWTSVTNTVAAAVGSPAETDSQLRARQAQSTAQPSQSMLVGLQAALANVPGVTRFVVYENDTNSADANGIPAHSICCVVEGGAPQDIGNAIWAHKGPGCGTYGTTTVNVTDSYGVVTPINYDVLGYVDTDVAITVKQLNGYTSDTTTAIQNAVASYLNTIAPGTDIYISSLWGAVLSANPNPANPAFSIVSLQACVHGGTPGTSDIPVAFNQAARGNTAYITVTPQ
ncbi:MAG: baseplate J/gp47 family protein [Alicyclobacillus sp.]|nr:baseplate J/gp47 family protein [Alicyclobacillus sp.]